MNSVKPNVTFSVVDRNFASGNTQLPADNINLCFVGGVSTGKSTILNAIFCEELTQCKIKRTTMVPTVYVENENDTPNLDEPKHIFEKIAQKNREIIEKTESGATVKDAEYDELQFQVGKLDINILSDSYVNVYDIPGLNDARTKSVYYKYLQSNFFNFNLVIFIVDIHSGLNTSDEADILNFIADHTRQQLKENGKKIYTLVVVNKADDMQLSETNKLEITGELGEMFDQVQRTITDAFQSCNISEHLIGIIPLCGIDSYLYRMIKKHGDKFKLSPEQILKIGINENGKKFSTLKPKTQEAKVREILNDNEFVHTMIRLSGFGYFENILHTFLSQNDKGKSIRIENLLFEYRKLPTIGSVMNADPENIDNVEILCRDLFKIFGAISKIDKEHGEALVSDTYHEIEYALKGNLLPLCKSATMSDLKSILGYYNRFRCCVLKKYFQSDSDTLYPEFIQTAIFERLCVIANTTFIRPSMLLDGMELCKSVDIFCKSNFQVLMENMVDNINKYSTIIQNPIENTDDADVIHFVVAGDAMGIDMTTFLRFVLLNRIPNASSVTDKTLFQKQMIYLEYGEVPIYSYLLYVNRTRRVLPEWVVAGITTEMMNADEHKLDLYYLSYISQFKK